MSVKNLLIAVTVSSLGTSLLLVPSFSFAQTATVAPTLTQRQEVRMQNLHARCDNEITLRLTSLNNLNTRIPELKKLSQSQISLYQGEIQSDITGLTNLKAKCDSDTNLQTLISDVKSIYINYRIYAVFIPQLRLLVASDTMDVTADNLSVLADKLDSRIKANEGKNVSYLNSTLADMRNQIKNAQEEYSSVQSQITELTPSSYPGSTPILKQARIEIIQGVADLKAAITDAKQIIQGLKALEPKHDTSLTSTPSPTPTQ